MEKLYEFQVAARGDGFVEVAEAKTQACMFRSTLPDLATNVHKRLCIDSLLAAPLCIGRLLGEAEFEDFPDGLQYESGFH